MALAEAQLMAGDAWRVVDEQLRRRRRRRAEEAGRGRSSAANPGVAALRGSSATRGPDASSARRSASRPTGAMRTADHRARACRHRARGRPVGQRGVHRHVGALPECARIGVSWIIRTRSGTPPSRCSTAAAVRVTRRARAWLTSSARALMSASTRATWDVRATRCRAIFRFGSERRGAKVAELATVAREHDDLLLLGRCRGDPVATLDGSR